MNKLLIIVFSSLLFMNCRDFKEIQVTGIEGFKINKISMDGIDGDVLLKLKNPNALGFSVYRSEFDVNYSGVHLGKAKLRKRVRIKGNAEKTYAFNLTSDLKNSNIMDVMKLLSGAAFKNTLEVKGDLKAGKFFLKKSFPVDLKEKISLN